MRQIPLLLALFIFSFSQLSAQIIDTVWSEKWEGDWIENWYVDGGTWEVGAPTSGPDTAYSGTQCAATVLNGNYSANINSRLIRLKKFVVPSANQNPRLRFWHWFSFSSNDYGYVQIKTEHGSWQNITPKYWGTSSAAWTYPSLDLRDYADSLVQIALYFHSDNNGYSLSTGWYVDDINLLTGPYIFDSKESFENGVGDWFAERGTWEVGMPTSGPGEAHEGENCLATILKGNYQANISSHYISPPFKITPASENPAIRFWHWYSFSSNDYGEVYIKTLNQDNWQIISNRFSGTSSGVWTTFYSDITDFADSIVQIAFYFYADNNGYSLSSGWYIDEMTIDGVPLHEKVIVENDLAIRWVEPLGKPLCGTGKEQPITIEVKNNGDLAVSNFEVGYSIDNGTSFVYETVFETVDSDDSIQYVFRSEADMAGEDFYNCVASVNIDYDIDDTNDVVTTIVENEHLVVNIETTDTKCNEATGAAEITSIEGRPGPYEIYWTTGDEDLTAENLESGVYFVTITDALGCSWTESFTINDQGAPEVSMESSINGVSCFGMMDGNINIIPVGGEMPYSYRWSNGAGTQNITDLRPGDYDVTITDSKGCAKNHSFLIEEPGPLKIKSNSSDAVCGEMNGSAELTVTGGTQAYFFEWNGKPSGSTVTGLAGGIYTAKVTDSRECINFTTVSINEIDAPQIIVTSINAASCGHNDGAINISVADVTLQYKYTWSDGSTSQDLQNAPAGFHSITISNQDESCSTSQVIEIPTKTPAPGEICMISVDSVTNENLVVMKDPINPGGISSANIYNLSKTGVYQYLNTIDPSVTNTTTDATSNTEVTSYRYRITQVDGCGTESEPGPYHETMHTVVTPDFSLKRANLSWNSYKGIEYNFFQIYRYSDLMGLEIIDTVPKIDNKDFYTYTDLKPPLDDTIYYVIVIELSEVCNSQEKAVSHNTIRSNKSKKQKIPKSGSTHADNTVSVQGLNIYPNPNHGSFNVRMETQISQDFILNIFDAQGKQIISQRYNDVIGSREERINLHDIKPGIYLLQLQGTNGIIGRSFVVQ